jgi:WD40 repeat protein
LIGGGAAAAVLLLGGIAAAVALNNNKKDRPTETAQARPDERQKVPVTDPNLTGTPEPAAKGTGEPEAKRPAKYLHLGPRGDVTLANTGGLFDPNKAFTVELWVRMKTGRYHQTFFRDDSIADESGPGRRTRGMAFRLGNGEEGRFPLHLLFGADAPEWWDVSGPAHPIDGEWHHLAVCKAADEVRIFRDGKLDAKKLCAGIKFYAGATDLCLGIGAKGHPAGSTDADFRAFRVTKGAIYENEFAPAKALSKTADTLLLLDFSSGTGNQVPDRSGHGHQGAVVGGEWADDGDQPPAPPGSPLGNPTAIAALPGGSDYLFVRKDDPALYRTVNGSSRKAAEVGRAASPIRTVAVTPDGSKAVTGGEDGTVGVWNLPAVAGAPAAGGPQMRNRIATFKRIDTFNGRWSLDAYQEGIVIHDFERKLDATISVGEPGRPVKGAFAGNLKNNAKLAEQLGQAVTDEIDLYGGDLIVQVFEGGAQFYSKTVDKTWFGWHAKRKAAADGGPGAAPRRADYVWVDDALPPGARPGLTDPGAAAWEFVGAAAGPVHTGQKAVRIVATGARQNVFADARPALRVGAGDVLFAYVYLDPKNPPEEIMLQWAGHGWQRGGFRRAYWGANKLQWGREGSPELKSMGPLPEAGQWVRLEVKIDDVDIQPGAAISSLALTQFGGTAYWDTIGVNTATAQDPAADAPAGAAKMLQAHTGPVLACAVSPDGSRAVTIGSDKLLCEWDLGAAKLVRKFEVPDSRAVTYIPDGKSVLVGTVEEPGGVWDLATGARTKELAGQPAPVTAVCVSPKGDLAWTAGADGQVRAWALPDFKPVGTLPNFRKSALAMAVAPGAEVLAIAVPDGTIHFFAPKTGASYGTHAAKGPIHALAFLPGGLKLAAAREPDPVVINVKPPDGGLPSPPPGGSAVLTMLQEADGGETAPMRMGYRPDGKSLWIARQKSMTVADGATGKEVKSWPMTEPVRHAMFGPGKELYLTTFSGKFQAWDWEKGETLHEYDPGQKGGPRLSDFWAAPEPNRLFVTTSSPDVLTWDTVNWKEVGRVTPYPNQIMSLATPYPDGARLAAMLPRDGGRRIVWDLVARREAFALDEADSPRLYRLQVSPGGKWIVGLSRDGENHVAVVWDGQTGKHVRTVTGFRMAGLAGAFSPGGDHFIACEFGGRRLDVNLTDGRMTDLSVGRPPSIAAVAVESAGLLATADADRKIRIWKFDVDTKPAEMVRTTVPKSPETTIPVDKTGFLKDSAELSGTVVAAALSPDGKRVFVGTQKGTVHVLDATTGEEKAKYDVCKGGLIHMVLSPKYISPVNGAAIAEKLYLLDEERKLHVWETDKGTRVRDVSLDKAGLPAVTSNTRVTIAANESHVLLFDPSWARGYSWSVGRWDETNIPPVLKRPPFNTDTKTVAFASDGSFGAAWASRKLLTWKVRGGKVYPVIDTVVAEGFRRPVTLAVAGEAGVVIAADSGRLQAWKIEGGTEVMNVREPHGILRDYHAAASANSLVTAGGDRWLRVWDLKAGKEAARWRLDGTPTGVAVSSDGRRAIVWEEDGTKVSLWALPDPKGK